MSEERDRFSQFMFGNRRSRVDNREEEQQRKAIDEDEELGGLDIEPASEIPQMNMEYFQILGQLDDIMTSIQDLKPLIGEISPLLQFIKQKMK
ncbi:hypothetical protein GJU40_15740 [Bacillus lacus]|uniref:Uncharacterized protein n=1 Tax=Metabacillus lacus TaxID=1983721 RepID=A0A7X2M0T1_9BACI|nr:hypothetical protein [Metabacillus lacus]MRX73597.1 hypothetical protein [Metabacillus lacus]